MATYEELRNLFHDSDTQNKAEAAVADIMVDVLEQQDTAANGYSDTDHDKRLKWAVNNAGHGIRSEAIKLLWLVLIKNEGLAVSAIQAATKDAFKTNMKPLFTEYAIQAGA